MSGGSSPIDLVTVVFEGVRDGVAIVVGWH